MDGYWCRDLQPVGLGAAILVGFLATISVKGRFGELSEVERGMYVTSFALAALAAVLLLAPAACLRLLPVHQLAGQVIRAANAMAVGGLAAAGVCDVRGRSAGGQMGRIQPGGRPGRRGHRGRVRCRLVCPAAAGEP